MRIGVSAVTLLALPHLVRFPNWPHRLTQFVRQTGFRIQLVPFQWWQENELRHIPLDVVLSIEGVWNPGETSRELLHRVTHGDPAALLGPILFGFVPKSDERTKVLARSFPKAWHIDMGEYGVKDQALSEFGPNHPDWQGDNPVAFDTWHAREVLKNDEVLNILHNHAFRSRIRLVHFQTRDRKEYEGFLAGERNFLYDVFDTLQAYLWKGDIVIELPPQWLMSDTESKLQRTATQIRKFFAFDRAWDVAP